MIALLNESPCESPCSTLPYFAGPPAGLRTLNRGFTVWGPKYGTERTLEGIERIQGPVTRRGTLMMGAMYKTPADSSGFPEERKSVLGDRTT